MGASHHVPVLVPEEHVEDVEAYLYYLQMWDEYEREQRAVETDGPV